MLSQPASWASYLCVACVQVIVLEKGRFTPAAELPLTEQEAFRDMYEMGSLLTTQDAGACISMMAVSTHSPSIIACCREGDLMATAGHMNLTPLLLYISSTCR